MKKIMILLLALLLLTGCDQTEDTPTETTGVTETTVDTTEDTTEPIVQSFYVEGAAMERGTGGAIKVYEIPDCSITGIALLGENLLMCVDGSQLYLLDHATLEIITQRELEFPLSWDDPSLVITGNRLAYFNPVTDTYVILDESLAIVSTVSLDVPSGRTPLINNSMETIFLWDEEGIRALDLGTGTSRLLRQEHEEIRSLDSILFDDSVLRYTRLLADGASQQCFIDTESGRLYSSVDFSGRLETWDSQYVTILSQSHPLGENVYLLTGSLNGPSYVLNQSGNWDTASFPGSGLAILQQENSVGLVLSAYDLNTGLLLSQVTMPQIYSSIPNSFADGNRIWLWDGTLGRFYCWDSSATTLSVETSMLTFYSTLEYEDEEGLLRCAQRATTLSKTYGVVLTLTEDDNRTENVDYSGYADYRPDYYMLALNKMEMSLAKFPTGFLETVAKKTKSGYIQIELVDDYDPAESIPEGTGNCDLTGKEITLSISMCQDMDAIFYHELFHAIETRILNTSDELSKWDKLNPDGFTYGLADNGEYTQLGSNYFTDAQAMTSTREDRAQIFMYAMLDGNEEMFASAPMQAKLSEICRLIRKTYSLDDSAILPWEQYLNN